MTAELKPDSPWRAEAEALAERRRYSELAALLVGYAEALRGSNRPAAARAFREAADTYERRFGNRSEAAKCLAEANGLDGTIDEVEVESAKVGMGSPPTSSVSTSSAPPTIHPRRRLIALHVLAAVYALPTYFFAGEEPTRHTVYRFSAIAVVGLVAFGWNLFYWFEGFYGFMLRLSAKRQARTGARVRVAFRGVEWDRDVGVIAAVGLQLRLLGLLVVAFAIWSVFAFAVVVLVVAMQDGRAGVASFFRR